MSDLQVAEDVPCIYSPCQGHASLEYDGSCWFRACGTCGGEFGYTLGEPDAGSCQLGVPASLQERPPAPVYLGSIGRRPA